MSFETLAPIIFVDKVEPCLPFWTDRLGFALVAEVPHEDRLGFAMLQRDEVTVMYQSFASVEADIPGLVDPAMPPTTALFFRVREFDALKQALDGVEVAVPERQTSYAARELFVRAPCGSLVGLAQMAS